MKNKLLMTTAIMSAALFALPAMAGNQIVVGPGETWEPTVNTTISGVATSSGALEVKSGTINTGADATITFKSNTSTSHGAALYYKDQNAESVNSVFNGNVTFEDNVSDYSAASGGAVFVSGGNVSFLGETNKFINNSIKGTDAKEKLYKRGGGAVANQSYDRESDPGKGNQINSTMVIGTVGSTNTFSDNTSSMNGGAVMNRAVDTDGDATLTINGTTKFENNTATKNGGAIYNIQQGPERTATINLNNGSYTFTKNTASNWGGAIHNAGIISLNNATFNENKAGSVGGAISNALGSSVLTLGENVKFTNNEAVYDGGAIGNYNGATLVNGATFTGNKAQTGSSDTDAIGGGAMSLGAESQTQISSATFDSNISGFNGGALGTRNAWSANNSAAKLDIANSIFTGNEANGGVTSSFKDGTITSTGGNGGAIDNHFYNSVAKEGAVYVADSSFKSNKAIHGGAIYNNGEADRVDKVGNMYIENSTFTNNTATTAGGAIYNSGILTIAGTTVFEGNKAGETLNDIHNTGTVTLKDNVSLDGGIRGNGTLVLADGMTLNAKAGTTKIKNNVKNNGGKLALTFNTGFSGSEYTLVTGSMDNEFAEDKIEQNSLYDIKAKTGAIGTYIITKKSNEEIAGDTGADANQASAISAVIASGNTGNVAFDVVANTINEQLQSGDATQVKAALDTITEISPEAAPVSQSVTTETTTQVFSAIGTRLSGGATAAANQGMSSGDSIFEKGAIWLQTLFNHAKLDDTSKTPGFKADTTGVAMGIEKAINDEVKAGIGYAYNDSEIKSYLRKTDVDTHTAFVYGEYKPSDWFVNAMMSYNWSDYDEKTATANAKYDVDSTALQAMTGYNFFYGNTTVTPEAGLRYIHIDQEAYKNSVGSRISAEKSDILTGVIGATVSQNVELENGSVIKPRARLAFTYDFKHDNSNSVVGLPNGSSYSVRGEALDRFGVETGLGLTAEINDEWEVSADYEYRFRDDYRDHTGMLNLKYKF